MANVMESLFGLGLTDQKVPIVSDPLGAFTGLGAQTGASLQRNITQAFGQQTQQQALSSVIQQTQQQVDLGTPEGLIQLANNLNQLPQFAGMAVAMRQQAADLAQKQQLTQAQIFEKQASGTAALARVSQEKSPFAKINPSDYTPASIAKFRISGNEADLVAAPGKQPAGTEFERLIADLPADQQAQARRKRLENLLAGGGMSPALVPIALKEADATSSISFGASEVGTVLNDLKSGTLKLGLKENFANSLKTLAGKSDEGSRAYSRFNTTLETLRNARLNLNVGVQTEGDAVRALNEFLANFDRYDTQTALQQLQRVSEKMNAAVKSKEARLRGLYQQSGIQLPADFFTSFGQASTPAVTISDDVIRREFNDPKNAGWQSLGFEKFKEAFLKQNPRK
jgi:hypothetical protein